jgi:hypothetical protein
MRAYMIGSDLQASLFDVEAAVEALPLADVVVAPAEEDVDEAAATLASETELAEAALEIDAAPYTLKQ